MDTDYQETGRCTMKDLLEAYSRIMEQGKTRQPTRIYISKETWENCQKPIDILYAETYKELEECIIKTPCSQQDYGAKHISIGDGSYTAINNVFNRPYYTQATYQELEDEIVGYPRYGITVDDMLKEHSYTKLPEQPVFSWVEDKPVDLKTIKPGDRVKCINIGQIGTVKGLAKRLLNQMATVINPPICSGLFFHEGINIMWDNQDELLPDWPSGKPAPYEYERFILIEASDEDPHKGMIQNPMTGEWKWL